MRLIFLALIAFVLTACGDESSREGSQLFSLSEQRQESPSYWTMPYSARFPLIDQLGSRFPGVMKSSSRGLWAGIFWQTKWQESSDRDQSPIWQYVNATLTIEPWYFAQDYLAKPRRTCSNSLLFAEFPGVKTASKVAICEKWFKYFAGSERSSIFTTSRNQRLLWSAHTAAISDALDVHEQIFADTVANLPSDEGRYWQGWVDFVYKLERLNFSTSESSTAHISKNLLAPCFALGRQGCELDDLNFRQRLLAEYLMNGRGDLMSLLTLL